MTFAEVLELGKARLADYESRLAVAAKRLYSSDAKSVQHYCDCSPSLLAMGRDEVQAVIDSVLDALLEIPNGFVACEADPAFHPNVEYGVASHNGLALVFTHGFSVSLGVSRLWVKFHYLSNP